MQSRNYDQTQSAILLHYTSKYLQLFNHLNSTIPTLKLNPQNKIRLDADNNNNDNSNNCNNVILDYSLNSKCPNHGYNNQRQSPNSKVYSNLYQFTNKVNHLHAIRKRQSTTQQDLSTNVKRKRFKARSHPSDEISQSSCPPPIEDSLRSPISGVKILPVNYLPPVQPSKGTQKSGLPIRTEQFKNTSDQDVLNRLQKIPNLLGDYICQLCSKRFPNAICLARHLCPRMANLAYPCELCEKVFNCPANLASHRRWHRPELNQNPTKLKSKRPGQNAIHSSPNLMMETFPSIDQIELTNRTSSLIHVINPTENSVSLEQSTGTNEKFISQSRSSSPLNSNECINTLFRTSKHYKSDVKNQVGNFQKDAKRIPMNTFSVEALLS